MPCKGSRLLMCNMCYGKTGGRTRVYAGDDSYHKPDDQLRVFCSKECLVKFYTDVQLNSVRYGKMMEGLIGKKNQRSFSSRGYVGKSNHRKDIRKEMGDIKMGSYKSVFGVKRDEFVAQYKAKGIGREEAFRDAVQRLVDMKVKFKLALFAYSFVGCWYKNGSNEKVGGWVVEMAEVPVVGSTFGPAVKQNRYCQSVRNAPRDVSPMEFWKQLLGMSLTDFVLEGAVKGWSDVQILNAIDGRLKDKGFIMNKVKMISAIAMCHKNRRVKQALMPVKEPVIIGIPKPGDVVERKAAWSLEDIMV
jgi:hypothetical protein